MSGAMRPTGRRRWLLAAFAGLAALAGAGVAWRRLQPVAVSDPAVDGVWSLQLTDPQGRPLTPSAWRGRPLVLNFWATWCPPCIEELPLLNRFFQENHANGWQVLGIAVDQPDAVRRFLAATPLVFPVAVTGADGLALSRSLGNLAGGLPFTVVLTTDGRVLQRKMGRVSVADLAAWVARLP